MSAIPIAAPDRDAAIEALARLAHAEGRRQVDHAWVASRLTLVTTYAYRLMDRRDRATAERLHEMLSSPVVALHPTFYPRVLRRVERLWAVADAKADK